jgi:hypothetical protein
MKLLFIPINKVLISGFFDYAKFELEGGDEVSSYGIELNGIWAFLKFGGGYAKARLLDGSSKNEYYWRVGIMLPNL